MRQRIAITGAAGMIGRLLTTELARECEVRRIDRRRRSGPLLRRQDVRRPGFAEKAFSGVDTVIDLAADASLYASWQAVRTRNIPATLGTFEAARRAGVRRVIFASSGHVTGLYERDEPYASICAGRYDAVDRSKIPMITSASPLRPDSPYAVGKVAGEAAARFYSEEFDLSIICLRIGAVYEDNRPKNPRGHAIWLSHGDLFRLVQACITTDLRFGTLYGVSANTWRFWDVEEGRALVGYEPADDSEQLRPRAPGADLSSAGRSGDQSGGASSGS